MQALVFNFPGLIVARLSLGMFEAGYSPMLPLYLSAYSDTPFVGYLSDLQPDA